MTTKTLLLVLLAASAAVVAAPAPAALRKLIPPAVPADRPAQAELTAGLRAKVKTLRLNGLKIKGRDVSRALLLLPQDRARAGIINFEIGSGERAGVYQCEALGRGLTSLEARPGWPAGLINGVTIYYAPPTETDGATVPGIYDLRNITPENYEIALIAKPDAGDMVPKAVVEQDGSTKPYFSGAWADWYPQTAVVAPVDMIWAEDFQDGSQGSGVPVIERRSKPSSEAGKARQAAQLAHNPRYYYGPYGRSGFAVHTDRWEDPDRQADPKYAGRPELKDFRFRDTSGCVKLRPGCLALLNAFISEQAALGRRVQLEVRETPLLNTPR